MWFHRKYDACNVHNMGAVWGLAVLALVGCSPQYSPPPSKVPQSHSRGNVLSDEAYVSYRNAHEHSPKIPKMILDLVYHHMAREEYLLARFYCDEYRRDFPSGKRRAEVEYLRVKALYLRYAASGGDDRMAAQVREEANAFLATYPRTPYRAKIKSMLLQMHQEQNSRYQKLVRYYEKRGKPKAAAFYREKITPLNAGASE